MNTASDPAIRTLMERVRDAAATGTMLRIRGGGSKDFYGGPLLGEILDTTGLNGITSYEPSELVVTALAGTSLQELEAALAERNQYLAFEPPHFDNNSTIGGMVAAGLSGPARVSAGAMRDFVLGASLINGRAELLTFGGQVMKNVAGYDISRVLAGSLGILGVITSVSLKVMPIPVAELTLGFDDSEADALRQINAWAGQPLPINASAWMHTGDQSVLYVRLRGAQAAVSASAKLLGGQRIEPDAAQTLWQGLRDHTDRWFNEIPRDHDLWRLSVPQTSPILPIAGEHLIEWHGGLRWYCLPTDHARQIRETVQAVGGHATLFRKATTSTPNSPPLTNVFDLPSPPLMEIHRRLKREFDPHGIFNRGRLYGEI